VIADPKTKSQKKAQKGSSQAAAAEEDKKGGKKKSRKQVVKFEQQNVFQTFKAVMGVTLTQGGRIKKGKEEFSNKPMNSVSFADDGIRKNYRMSRQEYAFRTEGGNLSRTSLYGANELSSVTKSASKLKPDGSENLSSFENRMSHTERKRRSAVKGKKLPKLEIKNNKFFESFRKDLTNESFAGTWDREV
jgi:hypothetical protein